VTSFQKELVLASTSSGRKKVLTDAGIKFSSISVDIDEQVILDDERIQAIEKVQQLSKLKVLSAFNDLIVSNDSKIDQKILISADTLFTIKFGDQIEIWGKPNSPELALERIKKLSNQSGFIYSGMTVLDCEKNKSITKLSSAQVDFGSISDSEAEKYLQTKEPLRCAGNFAIDGFGGPFISKISGDYFAIIGLSLYDLKDALSQLGYSITDFWNDQLNL